MQREGEVMGSEEREELNEREQAKRRKEELAKGRLKKWFEPDRKNKIKKSKDMSCCF